MQLGLNATTTVGINQGAVIQHWARQAYAYSLNKLVFGNSASLKNVRL